MGMMPREVAKFFWDTDPTKLDLDRDRFFILSMSRLVFICFLKSWVTGDCSEGCQNPASGLRAGFCQGDPLGEPSPSATLVTLHGTFTLQTRQLFMAIYLG